MTIKIKLRAVLMHNAINKKISLITSARKDRRSESEVKAK